MATDWTIVIAVVAVYVVYKIINRYLSRLEIDDFDKRYVLITGCDTGFGNLLAKRLDKLGCHVFAGCLSESASIELRKACSSKLKTVIMNVSKSDSVKEAYSTVKEALPEGRGLWAVVNNAGIIGHLGPPEWLTVDNYRAVSDVNLYGLIDVTMTFLPLVKREKGRIVNMSSVGGRITVPVMMPYCQSKYGVESFSDGLRRTLYPYGVKVSVLEPGWTVTPNTSITARHHIHPIIEKSWNQASPEIQEEYGEEYFKFCTTELFDAFERTCSTSPEPVIDAYQHAILGRYPQARYVVGMDGNYVFLPLQSLPEPIGDFLLYISNPKMPLPAKLVRNGKSKMH